MPSIPRIKKSDITRWTDETYFQRGLKYYEQGAIYDQQSQGMTLKSKCSGSQAPFYRQEVLFDNKGIVSANCSCPVGAGGHCKHAVALLLMWLNDPDSFNETQAVDALLEKRSKPELIAIIQQMLEQEPDLESLLELPLSAEESTPLDLKAIRRQAQQAFRGTGYYDDSWGDTEEIKRNLNPLLKLAAVYLSKGNGENAALIYETVIEAILDNEEIASSDEDGELLGVIYDCAEAIGKCLETIRKPKIRIEALQILFHAYEWDSIKMGGSGSADCVPEILTSQTTPEERIEIVKWTRTIMPKGNSWSDGYHREVLGALLLDLEADTLDDEAYLKICRQTGRLNDLIDRLLKLNRLEEAERAVREAEDYPLFKSIEIFTSHKRTDLVENIVAERVKTRGNAKLDSRLIEWLSKSLKQRGDLTGALELEKLLFWAYPNIKQYKSLRDVANRIGQWDSLRRQIINELETKKDFSFLIDLYLNEKEFGNALAALEKLPERWGDHSIHITAAQAAKKQYPREAIRIFTREAERFFDYRNRESYSQGAACLREVRDIHRQLNDIETWKKLIAGIREQYKKLPALQDELNKHKL